MNVNRYVCLMFGLSCAVASAAFKPAPIPKNMLSDRMDLYCVATGEESPFKKEPKYKGDAEYGQTYMGGKQLKFVAFSSSGGAKDTIVIDLNENGDVTDDVRIGVSKAVTVPVSADKTVKLILNKPDPRQPRVYSLARTEWYRGQVKLGDSVHEAVMMDMDMDGLDCEGQDLLLVDLNDDGVFKFDIRSYQMEGAAMLAERVVLKGDVWNLKLDSDEPDLTITPYTGDCGRLETSLELGLDPATCSVMGFVMSERTPYILTSETGAPSARIPVGSFDTSFFAVSLLKDGKPTAQLQYRGTDTVAIEKDKTCSVTLGRPGKMTVAVEEKIGKLTVSQALQAGEGAKLASIMTVDSDGKMAPPKPPRVEVRSSPADVLVAEGNMEYG